MAAYERGYGTQPDSDEWLKLIGLAFMAQVLAGDRDD